VYYEALDVYEQYSPKIFGIIQIPNPTYAIAHHGTVPNNPDSIPTLINLSPQQFIGIIANNPPTINAPTFANLMREFFRVLELEFPVKSSKKHLQLATFFW
jgi:hypothetical protein